MTAAHKKPEVKSGDPKKAASAEGFGEPKEPVVVEDIVTQTTETIEVVEEAPEKAPIPAGDPLSDFKEKMVEEELSVSGNTPKKNFMWPILFVFVIVIALLIGVFIYKQGLFKGEKVNVVSLSPTPVITVEPTKAVDLTQYEIEILNGSGVDGEAGRQRDSLEGEGFTISSVGNADNSDYTDTLIQAKKEVSRDFLNKLKTVLEDSFTVTEEELSGDASVPVIIILGTKK